MEFFSQFTITNNPFFLDELEKDIYLQKLHKNDKEYIKTQFFTEQKDKRLSNIIKTHLENQSSYVIFKREQIFLLLIMMYCGLIENNFHHKMSQGFYITDMRLLRSKEQEKKRCQEKLKCIRNYFDQFLKYRKQISQDLVCFTRARENLDILQIVCPNFEPKYVHFSGGKIESHDRAAVVDFADRNIGGLVLDSHNLAQEEIIMLLYPEAIISMLFLPPMASNEAVLIENLIKFNSCEGYEATFRWKSEKDIPNKINHMLAIDAMPFKGQEQFTKVNINRELLKCFVGFSVAMKKQKNVTISTGKWGCGIFRGNKYLKSIIQITSFLKAAYLYDSTKSNLIFNTLNDFELINFGKDLMKGLSLDHCYQILMNISGGTSEEELKLLIQMIKQGQQIQQIVKVEQQQCITCLHDSDSENQDLNHQNIQFKQ